MKVIFLIWWPLEICLWRKHATFWRTLPTVNCIFVLFWIALFLYRFLFNYMRCLALLVSEIIYFFFFSNCIAKCYIRAYGYTSTDWNKQYASILDFWSFVQGKTGKRNMQIRMELCSLCKIGLLWDMWCIQTIWGNTDWPNISFVDSSGMGLTYYLLVV